MSKVYLVTNEVIEDVTRIANDAVDTAMAATTAAVNASSTAANAATNAQAALDAANENVTQSTQVTLLATSWADNTQTVNVAAVTADNTILVSPEPSTDNYAAYTENAVRCIAQTEGALTFVCTSAPSVDVIVNVTAINK